MPEPVSLPLWTRAAAPPLARSGDYGVAEQVARHGLLPIIEPEVLIDSSFKAEAEDMLPAELTRQTDALPGDW